MNLVKLLATPVKHHSLLICLKQSRTAVEDAINKLDQAATQSHHLPDHIQIHMALQRRELKRQVESLTDLAERADRCVR